jgi:hypothetical protein
VTDDTALPPAHLPPAHLPTPEPRRVRAWPFLLAATALGTATVTGLLVGTWTPERTQYVHDAYVAWAEPIADDVAAIADTTAMTVEGELIYRASRPSVRGDEEYNEICALEGGAVLGCYTRGTIYVYAVTDERLAGTVEVTAAHEMLHAAYERLDDAERARVDALVAEAIAAIASDDPVYEDLALYPEAQLADEWHSRLGTEFADLPAALEAHYARYFTDRAVVVALHEQANALFEQLRARIDALVAEIDVLGPALDARLAAYEASVAAYNASVATFNARAASGDFASQQAFESARSVLVARGDAIDAEREALNAEVERYNGLVEELTALDADYADLYSSLDSTAGTDDVTS